MIKQMIQRSRQCLEWQYDEIFLAIGILAIRLYKRDFYTVENTVDRDFVLCCERLLVDFCIKNRLIRTPYLETIKYEANNGDYESLIEFDYYLFVKINDFYNKKKKTRFKKTLSFYFERMSHSKKILEMMTSEWREEILSSENIFNTH